MQQFYYYYYYFFIIAENKLFVIIVYYRPFIGFKYPPCGCIDMLELIGCSCLNHLCAARRLCSCLSHI
jgi:hypothetical protein